MTYPLLFPYGEPGYSSNYRPLCTITKSNERGKLLMTFRDENYRPSMREFYSARIAVRKEFSLLHSSGRLFQTYVVDQAVKIQNYRLAYYRNHQTSLRVDSYLGIDDYLKKFANKQAQRTGQESVPIGKKVILPATFTDSTRYLQQKYQDAAAMVREFGKPDLFITFTCNPQWKEITENVPHYQKVENRPDLIDRVFRLKCNELIGEVVENQIFGNVASYFYSIEFQKRGLPHMHLYLILKPESKIMRPEQVDKVICAEIPILNNKLYALVERHMIHGPCGKRGPHSPCMKPDKKRVGSNVCSKHYPKKYNYETTCPNNGYPNYRRRDNGITVQRGQQTLGNEWVVPYNPYLLLKFEAHINVEVVTSLMSVKYLYKYILKGHDTATLHIVTSADGQTSRIDYDEISQFINTRYVTPPEGLL